MEVPFPANALLRQFIAFATMRAVEVLPVPFCPVNKKRVADFLSLIYF